MLKQVQEKYAEPKARPKKTEMDIKVRQGWPEGKEMKLSGTAHKHNNIIDNRQSKKKGTNKIATHDT